MIVGVGVDILEHEHARSWDDTFLRYAFSAAEREEGERAHDRLSYFAGRFCVKEAAIKAFNGWAERAELRDIETFNDESGQPHVRMIGALEGVVGDDVRVYVSISHDEHATIAFLVAERPDA